MAMIDCPECGKRISDQARACPGCGCPTKSTQTIEATGKKWKSYSLAGWSLIVIGIFTLFSGMEDVSFVSLFLGITLTIAGRAGKWWYHE